MEGLQSEQTRPEVSVIIPARNEEVALGTCLASLVPQQGVDFEIIVVDDHSGDGTRQIAEAFPGVRIVTAGPLLPGWNGKNNAVVCGASYARGEWLLFTDADTVHRPGSLARSLAEAKRERAVLLSYSPQQDVRGFWEKATMPVIFAELACTFRPAEVSDPRSATAAANGQYLLVSRKAYDAVGGHRAVAENLLEDVALARAIKQSGGKIHFRYGGDAVHTRMYRSFAQLREGWTKNLALLFPEPVFLATKRLAEFVLILGGAGVALFARRGAPYIELSAAAVSGTVYCLYLFRIRKAHFSLLSNVLSILGLPVFAYLLLRSRLSHQKGSVVWKGRMYSFPAAR